MSKNKELTDWATPILSTILPLPNEDLQQIVTYATTSPDLQTSNAVAEHFTNLLGHEPAVLCFIQEFNSRVFPSSSSTAKDDYAPPPRRKAKQKAPLNKLPPLRRPNEGQGYASSGDDMFEKKQNLYIKKRDEGDYMTLTNPRKSATSITPAVTPPTGSRSGTPAPTIAAKQNKGAGTLTSDLITTKSKKKNAPAVVHLSGGSSMRAPSEDISDLSSALRSLEMTTNPTLPSSATDEKSLKSRFCGCNALKHDLLLAAPNCLACGKITCIKEGLGPCTFCGASLISAEDIDAMRVYLRNERGKEKMEAHNAGHKTAEVARSGGTAYGLQKSTSGTSTPPTASSAALTNALTHRDKLLSYQSTSAQRTKIIDQAADFETPDGGTNMWATPQQRALQLRAQQKKMREMEWASKDDWEKRKVVVAIDLKGRKIVREMRTKNMPTHADDDLPDTTSSADHDNAEAASGGGDGGNGAFSKNPLLKGLIKPTWKPSSNYNDGTQEGGEIKVPELKNGWRKVQDDKADNEELILDGGDLGNREMENAGEPETEDISFG